MVNTGRINLAEELGRIDSERMNRNRRAEKNRVIHELNAGYKKGGKVTGIAKRGFGRALRKGKK